MFGLFGKKKEKNAPQTEICLDEAKIDAFCDWFVQNSARLYNELKNGDGQAASEEADKTLKEIFGGLWQSDEYAVAMQYESDLEQCQVMIYRLKDATLAAYADRISANLEERLDTDMWMVL